MPGQRLVVQTIGGPTALLTLAGLRILIDPTFSEPGEYESAPGRVLTKTEGPAVTLDELGDVHAVLLSHDQHVDNLDPGGKLCLEMAPVTLTTESAARRLGGSSLGMHPWERTTLTSHTGARVTVTAVPAQHGPDGTTHLTGEVTGFVLTGDELPTVYVSGDNASLTLVSEIAQRFQDIDVAVIFAGAAKSPKLLGDAYLTLTGEGVAEAARRLGKPSVVPVHYSGWGHFTEGIDALTEGFERAGIREVLNVLKPGSSATFVKWQTTAALNRPVTGVPAYDNPTSG